MLWKENNYRNKSNFSENLNFNKFQMPKQKINRKERNFRNNKILFTKFKGKESFNGIKIDKPKNIK